MPRGSRVRESERWSIYLGTRHVFRVGWASAGPPCQTPRVPRPSSLPSPQSENTQTSGPNLIRYLGLFRLLARAWGTGCSEVRGQEFGYPGLRGSQIRRLCAWVPMGQGSEDWVTGFQWVRGQRPGHLGPCVSEVKGPMNRSLRAL